MKINILLLLFITSICIGQDTKNINNSEIETLFLNQQSAERYQKHLYNLTQLPHITTSKNNEKVRDYIVEQMKKTGLEVEVFPYDVYLPVMPGHAVAEIVTPSRVPLNSRENIYREDIYSGHKDLTPGFNSFTGSGDVTGEVVYVNYGRKEDFEELAKLGVSVKGKIVLARYGGNFRGYKAKFAQENGAIGLIIFTDPGDSGYMKGLVYPEGPYYDESSIQRGSLLTMPWTGDPLTPFEPALPMDGKNKIKRIKPEEVPTLLTIPVMPLPYGSAREIISRMKGKTVPQSWQGGLPYTYRLEGGSELSVRLNVHQDRAIQRIYNVVGTLKGSTSPDEWVIAGCHYDAWNFGTLDPNSGTAMLITLSESLGKMAKEGIRPKRTIKIAHWDAEEVGLMGSTEWVEQFRDELSAKGVAYLNADAAVSGRSFGGAASPTLKGVMIEAARAVTYPDSSKSVFDIWKGKKHEPEIGNLGGGSDHLAFYTHIGIPSWGAGTGGVSIYHSIYDNYAYYTKFTDSTFKMGPMVEQIFGVAMLKLANDKTIPYSLSKYGQDSKMHFESLQKSLDQIERTDTSFSFANLIKISEKLKNAGAECEKALNKSSGKNADKINKILLSLEREWIDKDGNPFGSWYKSLYASSDPYSGYASWMMPAYRYELSQKSTENLKMWEAKYIKVMERLMDSFAEITALTK
ncbi:MAG: M28 family peptidase [Saprospiraceae bacterium]|jgi:N-acetylated-alpha-linked acidic dipeptidase|nr:M28 family peptidase [Saprospiraceae bacterium]